MRETISIHFDSEEEFSNYRLPLDVNITKCTVRFCHDNDIDENYFTLILYSNCREIDIYSMSYPDVETMFSTLYPYLVQICSYNILIERMSWYDA